jgi:SAM-dependent MidA family methyltransferase
MPGDKTLLGVIRNFLQDSDLRFRDFVELALYYPGLGYYARPLSPVGKEGDYVTSPAISPVFGYALNRLISELLSRTGGGMCSVVDIGCGDGTLINSLWAENPRVEYFGVDRSLERVPEGPARFVRDLADVPRREHQIVFANELFDALPFARLVMRGEHLHELWVTERDGQLDWSEHEADAALDDYFHERGVELEDGQFADVSLDWESLYSDIARFVTHGLIVTFDYGLPAAKLFRSRIRRFGTAAAYSQQRVSRDLLANPGEQDLTAHINFTDLQRAGERAGFTTLFFDNQAKFLLSIGAQEHPLLQPDEAVDSLELREARELAKRLILPDGIGEDIRVLVQGKGVSLEGWSFQRRLF